METFYVSCSFFLVFVSFAISYFLFSKGNSVYSSGRLPPGNTGWPVIGESLEFLSTGWKGYPEKFIFDRMTKYSSNVFRTHLVGEKVAVFCGAAGNKFLFSNDNKLVQAWWPDSVDRIFPSSTDQNSSRQEEAIKIRKMLPNFLKPEALQRHIGIMDHIARRHFSSWWENKDEVAVFPLCKKYTFSVALKLFVSIEEPNELVAKLLEPFDVLAAGLFSVPIDLPGTPLNKAVKAADKIRKMLVSIIKQRKIDLGNGKASPTQDIMSHMLTTIDENGKLMHESGVADKIIALLIGGHDSASSVCTFVVKYLAELPEIYEGVYKEQMEIANRKGPGELLNWEDVQMMKYSWNVACEVIRLAPPLQGAFKEAITDFTFNGFSVPRGWKIYWSVNATHRNPECFPEPLKFDPTRFDGSGPAPYTFVPFAGGPRMCPGKEYARLEILVFMHNLVKRFKWEKIIVDEKIVFDPNPIPAKGLPVFLFPHKP